MLSTPMTKQRLSDYRNHLNEISSIEEEIQYLRNGSDISDIVISSQADFPYHSGSIIVRGLSSINQRMIVLKLRRKTYLEIQCNAIEKFIENLDNDLIKRIITIRFLDGLTVEETAEKIGYCRRQVTRHFKNFFDTLDQNKESLADGERNEGSLAAGQRLPSRATSHL